MHTRHMRARTRLRYSRNLHKHAQTHAYVHCTHTHTHTQTNKQWRSNHVCIGRSEIKFKHWISEPECYN